MASFEQLESLPMPELRQRWKQAFGRLPSTASRREFLIANLAYRAQEQATGGLSERETRYLHAQANRTLVPKTLGTGVLPGTKLVRMWKGEPHEVCCLPEGGFVYRNQTYASLSAIANLITGTKWNGNVFFGLKKAKPRG